MHAHATPRLSTPRPPSPPPKQRQAQASSLSALLGGMLKNLAFITERRVLPLKNISTQVRGGIFR